MKKKISFIIISIFFWSISFSQKDLNDTLKYEIEYDLSYQINNLDTLNIRSEKMVLKIAKNFSYFISLGYLKTREMIKNNETSNEMSVYKPLPKTKFRYIIIKDHQNEELIFSDLMGTYAYTYKTKLQKITWELQNEQKEIMGYMCKKATTHFGGRDYVAWYSEELSVPEGPYKFYGLPGLIFSIYDSRKQYNFNVSSIRKVSEYFSSKDEMLNQIQITEDEYKELNKKFKDKPSTMLEGNGISFPKEQIELLEKKAKEKFKYENNPIELTD